MSAKGCVVGEITIIGTGGGYGESILINLGNSKWVIIDSCQNPNTKECLPLTYLRSIGVNIANDVKLIICTHWHDDHIRGISDLLNACYDAEFCMSSANDIKKFMQLMALDHEKAKFEVSNSSTLEFGKCVDILIDRGKHPIRANANKNVYSIKLTDEVKCEVFTLSPSDYTLHKFDEELSTLMTDYQSAAKKLQASSPNSKSVAVFLKFGVHGAILGADLETTNNADEGWYCILDRNTVIDRASNIFKIPHHGSENGFCQRIWDELLVKKVVSTLTPWNKNGKLPEAEMLHKYFNLSSELYMTSLIYSEKAKKRDKRIEKMLRSLKCKIREVKFAQGIIRCRINLLDPEATWQVETLENAERIDDSFFG